MRKTKIGVMDFHGSVDITDPCYNKGQEKSNFPKKVMGMVLTNPPKRGIFITLISTRTA